jgi:hypothetical protein
MPPQHRFRLHDHQGGAPLVPVLGQEDPKESVPPAEAWALDRSGQRGQSLTEHETLECDGPVSPADESDRSEEYERSRHHPRSCRAFDHENQWQDMPSRVLANHTVFGSVPLRFCAGQMR